MDLLFRNLSTLIALKPSLSNPTLLKNIYKNLFQVPDQLAFEQIVHFLLNVICPKKCKDRYIWPLEKGQVRGCERKFLTAIREIVMELREDYPQYGVPSFTASFLSNPSGPRFTGLMIKLSVIALDLQIRDPAFRKYSEDSATKKACIVDMHVKIFKLDAVHQRKKLQHTDAYIEHLRLESTKLASSITEKMRATNIKIKDQETELTNWLANNLVIPAEMKTPLLNVRNQQVMMDWRAEIETKRESTEIILEKLKELDRRMGAAYKIIEAVIALRKANLCLDGLRLHFKVSIASLGALVPAIENLQQPLHTKDGTIILGAAVSISYECLTVLIDVMQKKGMLNYIRSFPHLAIKEQSARLKQLSTKGKIILDTVSHLTMTSKQLIITTIDAETMSDMDTEWMEPYRLEDLMPPSPIGLHDNEVSCKLGGIVGQFPGSGLTESSDHEEQLNAILSIKPDSTPPKDFFKSSPVKHWMRPTTHIETIEVPIATEKKIIAKASRLPVLCSSTSKYSTSVSARNRLVYSCRKVNNVIEDESCALGINAVPTQYAKSSNASLLSPVLSPLAVELADTPGPITVRDVFFEERDSNTLDILKHMHTCCQSVEGLVTPKSGGSVDVISYNCGEFDESNDGDISNIAELLNSGTFSPTESIIEIDSESFSCLTPTPSNCSVIDLSNGQDISGLKSKDCSVSFVPSGSKIENISPPTENKRGKKTPSTLERIITRYKKFKDSVK